MKRLGSLGGAVAPAAPPVDPPLYARDVYLLNYAILVIMLTDYRVYIIESMHMLTC